MIGIGTQSSYFRHTLFRAFASSCFRRNVRTNEGVFEAFLFPRQQFQNTAATSGEY